MEESKRAKTSEGEDGVDLISNLPDPILTSILSRIPSTEEVFRTRILSRRWRYLWTSVPSIDIDYTRDILIELDSNRFKMFVYWVLLNKPLDLDGFRLWCADYYNMATIRRWIHAAVMRKVKLLDLMFCPIQESENIEAPHFLVNCSSLEVLKLCLMGCHLSVPKSTGFAGLRVLELNDVELKRGDLVKYFLESCPLLEDLSLLHCNTSGLDIVCPKLKNLRIENRESVYDPETEDYLENKMGCMLRISCPKLVFLNLAGSLAWEFLFENLDSLKKAVIHIRDFFEDRYPTLDVFYELFHVESLSISLYCVGKCCHPQPGDLLDLPYLKTLELTVDDAMYVFIPFLQSFPDLESLHLIFIKYVYGLGDLNLEEPATISLLTRALKKVEFLEFDEEKPKLAVARALLEHGNLLEEMVFSWGDEGRFHERSMETMNQVSKFHKASSTVKLKFVFKPRQVDPIPAPKLLGSDSGQVESSMCESNSSINMPGS